MNRAPFYIAFALACAQFSAASQLICGNGLLSAAFDAEGVLNSLLWPGPGGTPQLEMPERSEAAPSHLYGCQWGIGGSDGVLWQQFNPNGVFFDRFPGYDAIRSSTPDEWVTRETVTFHGALPVMAIELTLTARTETPLLLWFQDFNPATALSPLAAASPYARDFAAFFDPAVNTAYQFRPASPSSEDRARAAVLAAKNANAEDWALFEDGVWLATASAETLAGGGILSMPVLPPEITPELLGALPHAGYGDNALILRLQTRRVDVTTAAATIFIAAGRNRAEVDGLLREAIAAGTQGMAGAREATYAEIIAPKLPADWQDEHRRLLLEDAMRFLLGARDPVTGAVVHAPAAGGPPARRFASVWTDETEWITAAFLAMGMPEAALAHLEFCMKSPRMPQWSEAQPGSFPLALGTDGAPASPPGASTPAAAAGILLSLWQYAQSLDDAGRQAFLLAQHGNLDRISLYLARQFSTPSGLLAPAFDSAGLRDSRMPATLVQVYLGLSAAQELYTMLDVNQSVHTSDAVAACESQIRFAILNNPQPWPIDPSVAWWMEKLLDAKHPLWKTPIQLGDRTPLLAQARVIQAGGVDAICPDGRIDNALKAAQLIVALLTPLEPGRG